MPGPLRFDLCSQNFYLHSVASTCAIKALSVVFCLGWCLYPFVSTCAIKTVYLFICFDVCSRSVIVFLHCSLIQRVFRFFRFDLCSQNCFRTAMEL